jgi:hypothetical protein
LNLAAAIFVASAAPSKWRFVKFRGGDLFALPPLPGLDDRGGKFSNIVNDDADGGGIIGCRPFDATTVVKVYQRRPRQSPSRHIDF